MTTDGLVFAKWDGRWVVRSSSELPVGEVVQVRTRSGDVRSVRITQFVNLAEGGVHLQSFEDDRPEARVAGKASVPEARRTGVRCSECGRWFSDRSAPVAAVDLDGIAGQVCLPCLRRNGGSTRFESFSF